MCKYCEAESTIMTEDNIWLKSEQLFTESNNLETIQREDW